MITSPQTLTAINPTEGLVQYVQSVKPYHTKILEVLVEYVYTDPITVVVQDSMFSQTDLTNILGLRYGEDPTIPQSIELYAATSISDQLQIELSLSFFDSISAVITDIRPVGYGMDLYSDGSNGTFGSVRDPSGLAVTTIGSGIDSTYTLLPDGLDAVPFDV
jgi:hypothetical protein